MSATTTDLILFWNMETLNGADMEDLSGYSRHGTISGTTDFAGKVSRARDFDGVDDEIETAATFDCSGAFTACSWLDPDAPTSSQIFWYFTSAAAGADVGLIVGHYGNGQVLVQNGDGTQESSSTALASSGWVHVAVTKTSAGAMKVYVNGTDVTVAAGASWGLSTAGRQVGQKINGANDYNGRIDEMRLYKRALSASEITDIYDDLTSYPVVDTRPVDSGIARNNERKVWKSRMSLADFKLRNY